MRVPRSAAEPLEANWTEGLQLEVLPVLRQVEGEFARLWTRSRSRSKWPLPGPCRAAPDYRLHSPPQSWPPKPDWQKHLSPPSPFLACGAKANRTGGSDEKST